MSNTQPAVHPLQPRAAQAVTGAICLAAVVFAAWPLIIAAAALVLIALIAPRFSPVNAIFRRIAPPASELEPVAPVRFAQWLAVGSLGLAGLLFIGGATPAGWVVTGAVAAVALFSAITGICVGCEIYRAVLRWRASDEDLREALDLKGSGPWLAVLTAPGCARCAPAVERTKAIAGEAPVAVVNLAQRPAAAAAPVRSVPAVLAVGRDGQLLAARAGVLSERDIGVVARSIGSAALAR